MGSCTGRKLLTIGAILLTIVIAVLQLVVLCTWSEDEFKKSSCKHSKGFYKDLHLSNGTAARRDCENHVESAVVMNAVAITANVISILVSITALFGVSEFFGVQRGSRTQSGLALPYCFYHFVMIPVSVFSDMYFNYIPLAVMIIGIVFYLIFIATLIAYLRSASPTLKKTSQNKAKITFQLKKSKKAEEKAEKGKAIDEMFNEFKYKKMKPAYFSSD